MELINTNTYKKKKQNKNHIHRWIHMDMGLAVTNHLCYPLISKSINETQITLNSFALLIIL